MTVRSRRAFLLAFSAVLLASLGLVAWRASELRRSALDARVRLAEAQDVLSDTSIVPVEAPGSPGPGPQRLVNACATIADAHGALQDVSSQVQLITPLLGAIETLPSVGSKAKSQASALEAGTYLASAGASLCRGVEPLSGFLRSGDARNAPGSAARALAAMFAARPSLVAAEDQLGRAQEALASLPEADLDEDVRRSAGPLRERLPVIRQTLRDGIALLDLAGANGPRRYLLISQNVDEIRATGGYIGSAGVIELSSDRVSLVEYQSSLAYDTPRRFRVIPPAPLAPYLGSAYWHLRGANWSPSFPDVARQLEYFYGLARSGKELDGVIAIDQVALTRLLEVLGPVRVAEYGETVQAADLAEKLDRYVHDDRGLDELGRKHFTAALSASVLQAALTAPGSSMPSLVAAVRGALDEQHVLVSVRDAEAGRVVSGRRWDGRLLYGPDRGDYLFLVDTEVSTSKHSQEISRDAEYRVDLAHDGPSAHLAISYANDAQPRSWPGARFVPKYRDFLRVYAPAGAILVGGDGFEGPVSTGDECGLTVFSGEVAILAGTKTSVALDYRLPPSIAPAGTYALLVQQQPGASQGTTRVVVNGPDGTAAAETAVGGGQHRYWRYAASGESRLEALALPEPRAAACAAEPVLAAPAPRPAWIEIPSVEISAPVAAVGEQADGDIESPEDPQRVGWDRRTARAGQPGNSVMSGATGWWQKPAVLEALGRLRPGDSILVRGENGTPYGYTIEWNKSFPGTRTPLASVLEESEDTILTLAVCGGAQEVPRGACADRRVIRARLPG